ncbi:MAG TPA: SDR family oxidoreductase [Candidatus Dormibacteraeota bacterium]|jgi:NAD(P)-dependent dehydrogenase (short-subunit alcohol dehydrogenase family)|nr:SDR family oxidoreductase [Candidatus Dormibacteraeota bacterium]
MPHLAGSSDLSGKRVMITGGAGDIGRAMAGELLASGAQVTVVDRLGEEEAATRLAELTPSESLDYVRADVTDREAVDRAVASVDRLDVAIGNAGIVDSAPFLDITEDQWTEHLAINLTGYFHLAQAAARRMVADRRPGLILFTGSWVGERPWPEIAAYSATKAGVQMLARSAALELAPHGIRVNVIAPGIVRAGLAKHQMETEPQYVRRMERAFGTLADYGTNRPLHADQQG